MLLSQGAVVGLGVSIQNHREENQEIQNQGMVG